MKIFIVSDSFPPVPSGVSKYTFWLAEKLLQRNHKVYVITGGVPQSPPEDLKIKKLKGEVIRLGKLIYVYANGTRCWITLLSIKDLFKMKKIFRVTPHDIVILQGPLGLTLPYPATLFSKSPKIGIFHSVTEKPNLGFILFKPLMKPFLKAIDLKIAVSRWAKYEIERYFGKQDFIIIPPGVDTKVYNPNRGKKSSDSVNFLFVGRLDERKGADILIHSWSRVKNFEGKKGGKSVPLNLLIAGDGPLKEKLAKRAGNSVKFLGFIPEPELPSLYASADVSVFPSKGGESFGIVLIESMACGTPPIASKIKGYSDVVKHEETGLLFTDENDLTSKILELSRDENKRKKMSQNSYYFAKENYDWDKIADTFEDVLRKIKS